MAMKKLEAFAREAIKGVKTEKDLGDDFSKLLKKITVGAAFNVELSFAK
jgi:hypothetical protein